jgi:hypothetical protein
VAGEVMESLYMEILRRSRIIDVGERRISRTVREYHGRQRYVIYLPVTRNDLWGVLWGRKIPVKIFIEIPEDVIKEFEDRGGDQK